MKFHFFLKLNSKILFLAGLLVLLPKFLWADVITPLSVITLPALPVIIIIEALFVFLWVRKKISFTIKILKGLVGY